MRSRLQYLDWLRGFAVLLMIQFHVFESFLKTELRTTTAYNLSQFIGGWAAPLFLFMAGISLALVFDRMESKGASRKELLRKALTRGGWILLIAFAFRLEQVLIWFPHAPLTNALKVDILNCIGLSYILAGICAALSGRRYSILALGVGAAAIILATPVIGHARGGLFLDYVNGNGHGDYFPLFPWAGYTFAGAAIGYGLLHARARSREQHFLISAAAAGGAMLLLGYWINRQPDILFGLADYSRYSPHYVITKLGYILALLYGAYLWAARPRADRWSPLLVFGQTSLLIYWLHIEFVYGRLRFFKNTLSVEATIAQLLWLIPLMLGIALSFPLLSEARLRRGGRA